MTTREKAEAVLLAAGIAIGFVMIGMGLHMWIHSYRTVMGPALYATGGLLEMATLVPVLMAVVDGLGDRNRR